VYVGVSYRSDYSYQSYTSALLGQGFSPELLMQYQVQGLSVSDEELAYLGSGVGACSDRFRYFTKKRAYSLKGSLYVSSDEACFV